MSKVVPGKTPQVSLRNTSTMIDLASSSFEHAHYQGVMAVYATPSHDRLVHIQPGDQAVTDFVRCSYLGLDNHPDILDGARKAIANGYALAAVTGTDAYREAATKIFVTGSFWCGSVAMVASNFAVAGIDPVEPAAMTGASEPARRFASASMRRSRRSADSMAPRSARSAGQYSRAIFRKRSDSCQ